jgi:hypothetical protein
MAANAKAAHSEPGSGLSVSSVSRTKEVTQGRAQDYPHLADAVRLGGAYRHCHAFVIDSRHPEWPPGLK